LPAEPNISVLISIGINKYQRILEMSINQSGQQFPTKLHISPLPNTIVKKKALCKPFFVIFPLCDNDLAHFYHVKINRLKIKG